MRTTGLEGCEVLLYLCTMELWDQSPVTEAGSHPMQKDSLLRISLRKDRSLASHSESLDPSAFPRQPREEELQVMRFSRVRVAGAQAGTRSIGSGLILAPGTLRTEEHYLSCLYNDPLLSEIEQLLFFKAIHPNIL